MSTATAPVTVSELRMRPIGDQVWGKYIIMSLQKRRTKDGKEICNLRLGDRTGEIESVIWDGSLVSAAYESGKLIGAVGDVGQYNNRPQFIVRRFKLLEEDVTPYLPGPSAALENLKERFFTLWHKVEDPRLAALLNKVFTPEVQEAFFTTPGGRKIHHGYRGGLLEHSVNMGEMSLMVAAHYPALNRDLLLTGTLLHDIGKIREYSLKVVPEFTTPGKLLGHIVIGVQMVADAIQELRSDGIDFPKELDWMLQHMILSHHGEKEYGSPVLPMCPEALALHMIDNLDAKLFVFLDRTTEEGEDPLFSNYDPIFQQQFYKYRP